jgi:outer membrane lipoprotein SlyB
MRQVLFRLGLALVIAPSVIVLAWSEIPIGGIAGAALDATGPSVLIGGLVGTMIASLIGAVILRVRAAWVERLVAGRVACD